VRLSSDLGGGTAPLDKLKNLADRFWPEYPDISKLNLATQVSIIRQAIQTRVVQQDLPVKTPSRAAQYWDAATTGVADGSVFVANGMTFGQIDSVKQEAALRAQGYPPEIVEASTFSGSIAGIAIAGLVATAAFPVTGGFAVPGGIGLFTAGAGTKGYSEWSLANEGDPRALKRETARWTRALGQIMMAAGASIALAPVGGWVLGFLGIPAWAGLGVAGSFSVLQGLDIYFHVPKQGEDWGAPEKVGAYGSIAAEWLAPLSTAKFNGAYRALLARSFTSGSAAGKQYGPPWSSRGFRMRSVRSSRSGSHRRPTFLKCRRE
jgi:hypothetical protein